VLRFSASVQQKLLDRADLERRLRHAVAALAGGAGELGEFELYYQPKVATDTGLLTGVEALLRWHPIDRMPVAPDMFIPVAEETGLIVPLGQWVLREACLQAQRWRDGGTPLRVSVNVSPRQFREARFPGLVADVLRETGFDAPMLELELTEQLMMSDNQHSARVLRELKQLGVHIAVDDFGIWLSSLSHLARLPLDTLKIDRSFVRALSGGERSSETTVAALIALSKSLGLRVVAEGVETAWELDLLTRHGAYEVQGYYFARPMPPEELMREMLDQGRVLRPPARGVRAAGR
jgi:EAL domain-containing protein (putative c-di-GMP-specific phosphodiesterase class I)